MCKQGELYWAKLPHIPGSSVQSGMRPIIVISNNTCNRYSATISAVPLTSKLKKRNLPTHVIFSGFGLPSQCTALAEQLMTIDQKALAERIGTIEDTDVFQKIKDAVKVQLAI